MWAGILEILKNILKLLAYWFDPAEREKRRKLAIWNEFKAIEKEYRKALADGDPQKAALIDKQMREMREKYAFLRGIGYAESARRTS